MPKIKSMIVFMVMTLIGSLGVSAQEISFHDSVEKLLLLMKTDKIVDQSFEQIKPWVLQQIQQTNTTQISAAQSQIIENYTGKVFNVIKDEMSWDKIKEDYIQVYMSVYTQEEVQELIKFYQSPIGQKTIEKMPLLMQQSMAISQKYMKNILPRLQAITQEMKTKIENSSKE
jgi:hypothetical protein